MSSRDVGGKERWGTWEELVLACAVKRHGTKSWDFVAMEVQTRTSSPCRFLLSADDCRDKYRDLQRRFRNGESRKEEEVEVEVEMEEEEEEDEEEEEEEEEGDEGGGEGERRIPWLEELRKIRVDELRREVERYDVSIVSLQLKLKKLKEDRERSVSETENGRKKSDPAKEGDAEQPLRSKGEEIDRKDDEAVGTIKGVDPETKPSDSGQRIDESDRENRSFSESNSTEEKPEAGRAPEPETADEAQVRLPDPDAGGRGEERCAGGPVSPSESYNGSSETIGKDPEGRASPVEGREAELGDVYSATKDAEAGATGGAGRSNESSAESKDCNGEVEGTKESSEGLSSVGLSKKRQRKGRANSSSGDDDERASDGVSGGDSPPPAKLGRAGSGQLGRLVELLDVVRSHRYGRVFEQRLDSQDTLYYRSLIRKHVDLAGVSTRVEEGHYSSPLEFLRDLLLMFNNALVFYPKNSPESAAAGDLRDHVTRELMPPSKARKADPKEDPSPSSDTKVQHRSGSDNPGSQSSKHGNAVAPVVVSRKRSTLSAPLPEAAKPPPLKVEPEPVTREESERPGSTEDKEADNESKKRLPKGSRTNKSRGSMLSTKAAPNSSNRQNPSSGTNPGRSLTASTTTASKGPLNIAAAEKMELPSKKRSAAAANFLNRMKRTGGGPTTTPSATMTSPLLETFKHSGGGGGRGGDQRKGPRDDRKDLGSRKGGGGKQKAAVVAPPKRGVGRPPKKGVAVRQRAKATEAVVSPLPPPPSRTARKRARR